MRSVKDIINFQERKSELSYFQVGNENILVGDIMNHQEGRDAIPSFHVGIEDMRLSKSLMNSKVS
jgi:hypothetical protein